MSAIPLAEMEADYTATAEDQSRLTLIVDSLRLFISESHGEDRSAFRMDLFRYEALLNDAVRLKAKIAAHIEAAKDQP